LVGAYLLVGLRVLSRHGLVPPSCAFSVVATVVASFAAAAGSPHDTLRAPEGPGGQFRPLHQGPQLGPGDLGIDLVSLRTGAKAPIDSGDDVPPPQYGSVAYNAFRHHLGMLDNVRRRVDDPGDEHLPIGEPHVLPHLPLVLM